MRKWLLMIMVVLLTGCGSPSHEKRDNYLKVGTIAGPETELMEVAKKIAAEKHKLEIDIIEFNDYLLPNQALAEGSIDANLFQHIPYLEKYKQQNQANLVAIARTFIYPMGVYSSKYNSLGGIKRKAIIAIPNDPSNEARALVVLQAAGFIFLKPEHARDGTVKDIAENPNEFEFKEMDAAQLARALEDVDFAVINTNYAMQADLMPDRDALFLEPKESPYANVLVIRDEDRSRPEFAKLIDALHSKEVTDKAKELFKNQAIKAWKSKSQ